MTVEIPGYKIIRTLGKGGMATVYLAEQEIFERKVALKVMSKILSEDPTFGERFFREAKIVSQLVHPNIVTVHDVGVHEGIYYLSMEYIDGKDLRFLRADLTLKQKISAVKDIARALAYAGSKGYVHRDIKPENIMFHSADGRAVLTDFGIAKATKTDKSMTQTGVAIGTPHYMSPEQAKGKPVDPRSDLYSLGIVFFQLLSGHVPYDAESAVAIGIKHITEPVPLLPEGYEKLQPIIDTLMAKKPDDRYQSALKFIEDVEELNVKDLESLVKWTQVNGLNSDGPNSKRSESIHTRAPTIVTPRSARIAKAEKDDPPLIRASRPHIPALTEDVERFTVAYDAYEYFEPEKSSAWPWALGICILLGIGGFVLYQQKPELVTPWLGEAKKAVESTTATVVASYEDIKSSLDLSTPTDDERVDQSGEKNAQDNMKKTSKKKITGIPVKQLPSKQEIDAERPSSPQTDVVQNSHAQDLLKNSEAQAEIGEGSERDASVKRQDTVQQSKADARVGIVESEEILKLRERVGTLESLYETDKAYLADLVGAYHDLLERIPNDESSVTARDALKSKEIAGIHHLTFAGKYRAAEKRFLQVKYLFAGLADEELSELEKQLADQKQIKVDLARAATLFEKNQLTTPENDNAVGLYMGVLALDKSNQEAIEGLKKSSKKLLVYAQGSFNAGEYSKSARLLSTVLKIDSSNPKAKKLQLRLNNQRIKQRAIDALLVRARQQLKDGQLFTPPGGNALDSYKRVLEKSPGNKEAEEGIVTVVDALSVRVWGLVGDEKFDEARQALAEPKLALPTNEQIHSLSLAVEEVIVERTRLKPSVSSVQVSSIMGQFSDQETWVLSRTDNIYLRFQYAYFDSLGANLRLILVDQETNLETSVLSDNVTGAEGSHNTVYIAPVQGFKVGEYRIKIQLGENVLGSLSFTIK